MNKGVKITLIATSVLAVATGAFFIIRNALKKKNDISNNVSMPPFINGVKSWIINIKNLQKEGKWGERSEEDLIKDAVYQMWLQVERKQKKLSDWNVDGYTLHALYDYALKAEYRTFLNK